MCPRMRQPRPTTTPYGKLVLSSATAALLLLLIFSLLAASPPSGEESPRVDDDGLPPLPRSKSKSKRLRSSSRGLWGWNLYWAGNPMANTHPPQPAPRKHRPSPPRPTPSSSSSNAAAAAARPSYGNGNPFENAGSSSSSSSSSSSWREDASNNNDYGDTQVRGSPAVAERRPTRRPSPPSSSLSSSSNNSNGNNAGGYSAGRPSASQMIASVQDSSPNSRPQDQAAAAVVPKNNPSPTDRSPDAPPPPTPRPVYYVDNRGENWSDLNGGPSTETMRGEASSSSSFVWLPEQSSASILIVEEPPPAPVAPEGEAAWRFSAAQQRTTPDPTPLPTPLPTPPQFQVDAASKKMFCGSSWSDVIENCLTATPCPRGYAAGVCPDGTTCMADTPCSDPSWLDFLSSIRPETVENNIRTEILPAVVVIEEESTSSSLATAEEASSSTAATGGNVVASFTCTSNRDCPFGQFCAPDLGYCAICSPSSGRGCSVGRICVVSSDGTPQCQEGLTTEATISPPRQQQQQQEQASSVGAPAATYRNPEDNGYFCGYSFSSISRTCLQSRPCPSGVASTHCNRNEGCFYHPTCEARHASAEYDPAARVSFSALNIDEGTTSYREEEEEKSAAEGDDEAGGGGFRTPARTSSWEKPTALWGSTSTVSLLSPAPIRRISFGLAFSLFAAICLLVL